jgi:hydrogenase maturation protein HypF
VARSTRVPRADPDAAHAFTYILDAVHINVRNVALQQMVRRLNAPLASSMGRLFDAAGAVLGVSLDNQFEGQTAMLLEALAGTRPAQPLPFPMAATAAGTWILDPLPLLIALGEERARGVAVEELAARFHESIAAGAAELAARLAADAGLGTVVLSGGCFQNARLLVSMRARLEARGLRVLVPRRLSPNDGAVSYGQAAVAAALLRREESGS